MLRVRENVVAAARGRKESSGGGKLIRHITASTLHIRGMKEKMIQKRLRHSENAETLRQHYLRPVVEVPLVQKKWCQADQPVSFWVRAAWPRHLWVSACVARSVLWRIGKEVWGRARRQQGQREGREPPVWRRVVEIMAEMMGPVIAVEEAEKEVWMSFIFTRLNGAHARAYVEGVRSCAKAGVV